MRNGCVHSRHKEIGTLLNSLCRSGEASWEANYKYSKSESDK